MGLCIDFDFYSIWDNVFATSAQGKGIKMTNLDLNRIPSQVSTIHLIAICGTAMGALACMLKDLGYRVTGSDQHVYPPMSDFLKSRGVPIWEGFRPGNLQHAPDLVVVGNAISKDNPEVVEMHARNLAFCSMPQAINHFAAAGKRQVVVTGTHGKTTTASFIAWMLHCAQLDPSFLIGGIVSNFDSNFHVGQGQWMVLEGDEYDTAYFDKGPKFLHYTPDVTVLTSVEFDHADIFADLDQVKGAFRRLIAGLPASSLLLACDQDANIDALTADTPCRLARYGRDPAASWALGKVAIEPPVTRFEVLHRGKSWGRFETRLMGAHNLSNLLSAIAVGQAIGVSQDQMAMALETFRGVRRRQEIRGIKNGVVVIDDFAHHPTAVRETVRAAKAHYRDNRLIAVFEPRTNSSRRNVFQSVYADAFHAADLVCVRQAPLLEKIPPDQRFSSARLVEDLKQQGMAAHFFEDTDAIIDFLVREVGPGDVCLIMSNGGFDNIHTRLLERL